ELAGGGEPPLPQSKLDDDFAHHATDTALVEGNQIFLQDLDFKAQECPSATARAGKIANRVFAGAAAREEQIKERFVVLPDAAFDFLCETGTEVHTRVRIEDETKTVAEGALWTEESLPAETILAGIVQCERVFQKNGARDDSIKPPTLIEKFAT